MYRRASTRAKKPVAQQTSATANDVPRRDALPNYVPVNQDPATTGPSHSRVQTRASKSLATAASFSTTASSFSTTPITRGTKRKSVFCDIDLSDIKVDFPSFSTTNQSFIANSNESFAVNSESHKANCNETINSLNFDEFEFSDLDYSDILNGLEANKKPRRLNLSEEDKSNMIAVVKSGLESNQANSASLQFSDEISKLLDDDELELCELDKRIEAPFKTAAALFYSKGKAILYSTLKLEQASVLFSDIESLHWKEIACCLWNHNNQLQQK